MSIENPFQNSNVPEKQEQKKEKEPVVRDLSPQETKELGDLVRRLRGENSRE